MAHPEFPRQYPFVREAAAPEQTEANRSRCYYDGLEFAPSSPFAAVAMWDQMWDRRSL